MPTTKEWLTDPLPHLPRLVSRFLGYRPPNAKGEPDLSPLAPFRWLNHIPIQLETFVFGWIGAFGSILLIEAVLSTDGTALHSVYHSPIIIASFGAAAILTFGSLEAPLAQPRGLLGGHFVCALVSVAITRLFARDERYIDWVKDMNNGVAFHPAVYINGALSMATAMLVSQIFGCMYPPGGATALLAAVNPNGVELSWRFIPVVMVSSLVMLGWALIINNVGRRRFPKAWLAPTNPPVPFHKWLIEDPRRRRAERQKANRRADEEQGYAGGSSEPDGPSPSALAPPLQPLHDSVAARALMQDDSAGSAENGRIHTT